MLFQPSHARSHDRLWIASALFPILLPGPAGAQTSPRILHQGVTCIQSGRHAVLEALVEPADDLVTVKAYFRAEIYPAFFYVEMARSGDRYQAVLPKPNQDIGGVVYYLEAVDSGFNSLRTEEFHPRVVADASQCEDEPQPVYLDAPTGITVGATAEGASFPPGFLTEGIVGTITAAGRAAGGGSGTLIALGAAGGAAAGIAMLVGGDDGSSTSVPAVGITTTAVLTTSVAATSSPPSDPGALTACFETDPNPPTIPVGGTVRFDATCSGPVRDQIATYFWDFHDGRGTREGRVVSRVYNQAGVFPAELLVRDLGGNEDRASRNVRVEQVPAPAPGPGAPTTSTTTSVPTTTTTAPGSADLAVVSIGGPPSVAANVNASYDIQYRNNGPDLDPTVTLVTVFSRSGSGGGTPIAVSIPGCGSSPGPGSLTVSCPLGALPSGGAGSRTLVAQFPLADTYFITATISGGTTDAVGGNNSRTVSTSVALRAGAVLETAFLSEIQSRAPGQVQATIELNRAETALTDDGGPRRHALRSREGRNVLVGHASGPALEGALWRLDFSETAELVPGSLAIDAGEVVSLASRSVVFRLSSGAAEIRLRFRLER